MDATKMDICWTPVDTCNTALFSLVPLGVAVFRTSIRCAWHLPTLRIKNDKNEAKNEGNEAEATTPPDAPPTSFKFNKTFVYKHEDTFHYITMDSTFKIGKRDKNHELRAWTWLPRDVRFFAIMDLIVATPLGFASYLVWKESGGFASAKLRLALGLYGFSLMNSLALAPTLKPSASPNTELTAVGHVVLAVCSTATVWSFACVDEAAGCMAFPFALWSTLCALPLLRRFFAGDSLVELAPAASQTHLPKSPPLAKPENEHNNREVEQQKDDSGEESRLWYAEGLPSSC